jgi:hypothetical protein
LLSESASTATIAEVKKFILEKIEEKKKKYANLR